MFLREAQSVRLSIASHVQFKSALPRSSSSTVSGQDLNTAMGVSPCFRGREAAWLLAHRPDYAWVALNDAPDQIMAGLANGKTREIVTKALERLFSELGDAAPKLRNIGWFTDALFAIAGDRGVSSPLRRLALRALTVFQGRYSSTFCSVVTDILAKGSMRMKEAGLTLLEAHDELWSPANIALAIKLTGVGRFNVNVSATRALGSTSPGFSHLEMAITNKLSELAQGKPPHLRVHARASLEKLAQRDSWTAKEALLKLRDAWHQHIGWPGRVVGTWP